MIEKRETLCASYGSSDTPWPRVGPPSWTLWVEPTSLQPTCHIEIGFCTSCAAGPRGKYESCFFIDGYTRNFDCFTQWSTQRPRQPGLSDGITPRFVASKPRSPSRRFLLLSRGRAMASNEIPSCSFDHPLRLPQGTPGLTPLLNAPGDIMQHPSSRGTLEILVLSFICRHDTFPIEHPPIICSLRNFRSDGAHIKLLHRYRPPHSSSPQRLPGPLLLSTPLPNQPHNVHDPPPRQTWAAPVTKSFPGPPRTPAKASFLAATASCIAFRCASSPPTRARPAITTLTIPAPDGHEQPGPVRNDTMAGDPREQGRPRREARVVAQWRPRACNNRQGRHSGPRTGLSSSRSDCATDLN